MRDAASSLTLAAITVGALTACSPSADEVSLANPAATYCVEQGGTYTLDTEGSGGTCTLPSGQTVDAFEFFRASNL